MDSKVKFAIAIFCSVATFRFKLPRLKVYGGSKPLTDFDELFEVYKSGNFSPLNKSDGKNSSDHVDKGTKTTISTGWHDLAGHDVNKVRLKAINAPKAVDMSESPCLSPQECDERAGEFKRLAARKLKEIAESGPGDKTEALLQAERDINKKAFSCVEVRIKLRKSTPKLKDGQPVLTEDGEQVWEHTEVTLRRFYLGFNISEKLPDKLLTLILDDTVTITEGTGQTGYEVGTFTKANGRKAYTVVVKPPIISPDDTRRIIEYLNKVQEGQPTLLGGRGALAMHEKDIILKDSNNSS